MQVLKHSVLTKRRLHYKKERGRELQLMLLSLPGFLWFLIFSYIPMFGLVMAFKRFDYSLGILKSPWCGFDNFIYLFASNDIFRILRNTVLYNIAFIVIGTACAIGAALLLETIHNRRCIKFYQTSLFLPHFISWIIVAYMARGLLTFDGGLLNHLLTAVGLKSVNWYLNARPWPVILVVANIWKGIGLSTIMYYGALLGVDKSIYDAGDIDGTNRLQRVIYLSIPMIKPTIIVLFMLSIGNVLRADFGLFYYLPNNSGPLYPVTEVIDTYIYKALKVSGDINGSAATSFFQSVVGLIMVLTVNKIIKNFDENTLF